MIVVDIESRSLAPIKEVGAWAYARHESTQPLCIVGLDLRTEETMRVDLRQGKFTQEQIDWFNATDVMVAHNYTFEEAMFLNKLGLWGFQAPKRWIDTMDMCAYFGVPMSLEKAAQWLFQDDEAIRKDKEGKQIMRKVCTPFKEKYRKYTEEEFEKLVDYCEMDVVVTSEIYDMLWHKIPSEERLIMQETHEMNYRGIPIDRDLITRMIEYYDEAKEEIDLGHICIKREDLTRNIWLPNALESLFFYPVPDMRAETVEKIMDDKNAPEGLKVVLEARQVYSASSVKKLQKAIALTCGEGVVRNCFQYHGAKTGRFAGRGIQPQNMPRGFKDDEKIISAIKELGL